jgi:hypothetical protein
MDLEYFSPNDRETSRILDALSKALYPAKGGGPKNWHPSCSQV